MENNNFINIQPTTHVYKHYKFRSYSIWKALAEYIDNSTQNYQNNRSKLKESKQNYKLIIKIKWDKNLITIEDNAMGMDEKELRDAMVLGKTVKTTGGRNQFGMGLKTASCWFAGEWEVQTTKLNNEYKYNVIFDVDYISANSIKELEFYSAKSEKSNHGTKIILRNLNKKIIKSTITKLKKLLSSVYRSDIEEEEIEIWLNDELVEYKEPKLWNDDGITYKKEFLFDFIFDGRKIDVLGFAAIAIGSTDEFERGFSFFKNKRAIIINHKDHQLVGRTSSLSYQRLFGEIYLEGVDVTQDKSSFDWDNGLKEEIFVRLEKHLEELKRIANKLRKSSDNDSEKTSDEIKEVEDNVNNRFNNLEINISQNTKAKQKLTNINNFEEEFAFKSKFKYKNIKYSYQDVLTIYNVNLFYSEELKNNHFIKYNFNKKDELEFNIKISINKNHDFFIPYHQDELAREALTKLIISIVLSKVITINQELDYKSKFKEYLIEQEELKETILNDLEKQERN